MINYFKKNRYIFLPLSIVFLLQFLTYYGTKAITASFHAHDLTTAFDRAVPLIPWFIYIYLGSYAFWIINYLLASKAGRKHFYAVTACALLCYLVCAVIFIVFPTTYERPELIAHTFSEKLINYVFSVDTPVNLFPSMHCLLSWICYICVRGKKQISAAYRVFSLIFAILVCVSTQVVKQHYVVDIFGGILIAELMWLIVKKARLYRVTYSIFERRRLEKRKHAPRQ